MLSTEDLESFPNSIATVQHLKVSLENYIFINFFNSQTYIRNDIESYKPAAGDLAYPDKLMVEVNAILFIFNSDFCHGQF